VDSTGASQGDSLVGSPVALPVDSPGASQGDSKNCCSHCCSQISFNVVGRTRALVVSTIAVVGSSLDKADAIPPVVVSAVGTFTYVSDLPILEPSLVATGVSFGVLGTGNMVNSYLKKSDNPPTTDTSHQIIIGRPADPQRPVLRRCSTL